MNKGLAILLMLMVFMSSGCGVFDMVMDASYQATKTWGKENFPLLKTELGEFALNEVSKAKDELKAYTREKTEALGKTIETKVEARTGVPAPDAARADSLSGFIVEMKRWRADMVMENDRRREENERREKNNEPPGPKPLTWYEQMFWTAVAGTGVLAGRAAQKRDVDKRIGGYIRNVFGPNPGNGNGNGGGAADAGTKK